MRAHIIIFFVICLVSALPAHATTNRPDTPGNFDYYVFNLSWEPEFCHGQNHAGSEECLQSTHGFVVHGLWPQYIKGYPEHCSDAAGPADYARLLDVMPTTWLAEHEWKTHGTCSGLNADDYFKLVRQARKNIVIPAKFAKPRPDFLLTPAQIKADFIAVNPALSTDNMAISCGKNYLTAIEICLSKDGLKPTSCGTVHDCRANIVHVATH